MSRRSREWCITLGVLALLVGPFVADTARYHRQIEPSGLRTVTDHVARFGPPHLVYAVQHQGGTAYELRGFPKGKRPWLALPSGPPAYVYDSNGRFLDWCSDIGDQPSHRAEWPVISNEPLDGATVEGVLGITVRSEGVTP